MRMGIVIFMQLLSPIDKRCRHKELFFIITNVQEKIAQSVNFFLHWILGISILICFSKRELLLGYHELLLCG